MITEYTISIIITWEAVVYARIFVLAVARRITASRNQDFVSKMLYRWKRILAVTRARIKPTSGWPFAIGRVLFLAVRVGVAVVAIAPNAPAPVGTPH